VDINETYEQAAKRELKEELGVDLELTFVKKIFVEAKDESEMVAIFQAKSNGPFAHERSEIEHIRFYDRKPMDDLKDKLTPCALTSLKYLKII
jgi:ADP-ribose pyrophosphatase YjhB (NUDIX family)